MGHRRFFHEVGVYSEVGVYNENYGNFISESWVYSHDLAVTESDKPISIVLADGRQCSTADKHLCPVKVETGGYEWTDDPILMKLERYDIILGKPWLELAIPAIDFCSHEMTIQCEKGTFTVMAGTSGRNRTRPDRYSSNPEGEECSVQFISIRQARKSIKQGAECYAVVLEETGDELPYGQHGYQSFWREERELACPLR